MILQLGDSHVQGGVQPRATRMYMAHAWGLDALPRVPIVLIGVSDMGEKVGEFFRSYSNIPQVQTAQQRAARRTGVAYWDCRAAMGGENSILAWVRATPPLATADYVHFTPRGARYVGEMLYASLMADYAAYVKSKEEGR